MAPEGLKKDNETVGRALEQASRPGTLLDSIRSIAARSKTNMMALVALAGISQVDCDSGNKNPKDTQIETREGYEACAPFLRCGAAPRTDKGFTLVYEVPQNQVFEGSDVTILDADGEPIHEETRDFPSGTAMLDFTPSNVPGVEGAKEVVIKVTVDGELYTVNINVDFEGANDMFNDLD